MAGYASKKFHGLPGEDPLLWFQEFRQWVEASGIDVGAGGASAGMGQCPRKISMSWTCPEHCPVQVSCPNIPLYSVIIKDSN